MIEGITKSVLETLISQGGGWVIATLLVCFIIYLGKRLERSEKACDDAAMRREEEVRSQYDKRLEEMARILDALNRSTATLSAMQISVDARAEAMNNLVAGFAALVRDLQTAQDRWRERGEAVSKHLSDIQGRLEDVQRRLP